MGELYRTKLPCCLCDSSDAVSLYENEDVIDGYCFSCQGVINPNQVSEYYGEDSVEVKEEKVVNFSDILALECRGWRSRKVGKPVSELYGVRTLLDYEEDAEKRYYPITQGGELVGYKIRDCKNKDFRSVGRNKSTCEFFGQSLFSGGGKYLIICGGEEDAMSLQQALKKRNPKYTTAVVSPTVGEPSTAKQLKANYEWVTSFERVVLMLDNDKAGKEATESCLKLLKPGQGYVSKLTLKDPNEYLMLGREDDLITSFWKAERHSPIELMTLGQMWDEFESSAKQTVIPFPHQFSGLNEMMGGGIAAGEVTVLGALTSAGKSTIINNLVYSFFSATDLKIGLLYLESTPREIVSNLLSIHMEENLALERPDNLNMPELKKRFMDMVQEDNRIVSINHQGSFSSADDLFSKIEWMVRAMDTKVVIVDPLQAAVHSNDNNVIDEFMDRLLKLAKQTDTSFIVVSHMRKPEGKDPHAVSEYDLKGSSSINQIAFNTILASRDKMNADSKIKNSTLLQLVKCRRTGFTGEACWLQYDPKKARLSATTNPYEDSSESDSELEEIYGN